MKQDSTKIRYFLYARKSSESGERQVQSINDQTSRLKQLAGDLNLVIKKTYTEAKSAKKPNNRLLFDEMIERIENGEADGILCWQINRLSRNPIDSGRLSWLLQKGVLKSIRTIDRQYLPEDNVLLLNLESGVANQYILDLRKNVERSIQRKLADGWAPGIAPLGYLNTKTEARGDNYIIKDPERFPLIRKAWDLMLTGNYTPPKILEKLNNEWGFRTRKHKQRGNKPMSNSTIYKIFSSPFYAGIITYRDEQYEGKHDPMITLEEYDRVQMLLGRKGKPRPKKHQFAFTGCMHCGECGCSITAIEKEKFIKKTGELKTFTYHYCTRKKKSGCSQRQYVTLDNLELQIEREIEKYEILPEFLQWALEILNEKNDQEIEDRTTIYESLHESVSETQKQLDNLTQMRYRELINDDEFARERKRLQGELTNLKSQLRKTESRAENWLELTERTFKFATYARKAFITGSLQDKKEILLGIGQNPILQSKKLKLTAHEWLVKIENEYPPLEKEYERLELDKTLTNKERNEALTSLRLRWRATRVGYHH